MCCRCISALLPVLLVALPVGLVQAEDGAKVRFERTELEPENTRWLRAWDLRSPAQRKADNAE